MKRVVLLVVGFSSLVGLASFEPKNDKKKDKEQKQVQKYVERERKW